MLGDGDENSTWPLLPGFGQDWMEPFNIFHSVYSSAGLIAVLFAGRVLYEESDRRMTTVTN